MKNLKFLALLFISLSVGLTSCKKDDDKKGNIVGKWFLKSEVNKMYINGQQQGEADIETDFGTSDYVEFKSDGKGVYSEEGDTDDFTYQINNDATELTIVIDGETEKQKISKLTDSELVLLNESSETMQGTTFKYSFESTYKK